MPSCNLDLLGLNWHMQRIRQTYWNQELHFYWHWWLISNATKNGCRDNQVNTMATQIARFMGATWGPHGSCRPQMGPMLAPWTLLSGCWCPSAAMILIILRLWVFIFHEEWFQPLAASPCHKTIENVNMFVRCLKWSHHKWWTEPMIMKYLFFKYFKINYFMLIGSVYHL